MSDTKNYIHVVIDEYEDNEGKHQHDVVFRGKWKDSDHFLAMLTVAFEKWGESSKIDR